MALSMPHWERVMGRAHGAVYRAIKCGQLTDLKAVRVQCADCWRRADRYDHRDYTRPLDVAPVCHRCNAKRGPGFMPEESREAA